VCGLDADGGGASVDVSSSWEKRSTAMPRARKERPVRSQARKVRSLARWSRAVEPVLARGEMRRRSGGMFDSEGGSRAWL
jgi:hypothetical protein